MVPPVIFALGRLRQKNCKMQGSAWPGLHSCLEPVSEEQREGRGKVGRSQGMG
jgi:hypothetical protein